MGRPTQEAGSRCYYTSSQEAEKEALVLGSLVPMQSLYGEPKEGLVHESTRVLEMPGP